MTLGRTDSNLAILIENNVHDGIVARSVISPPFDEYKEIQWTWQNYGPGDYTVTHIASMTHATCKLIHAFLNIQNEPFCQKVTILKY